MLSHKQGAVYKVMTRDMIISTKVALEFRFNLKTDQTCWVSVCSEAEPHEVRVGLFEMMQDEGNG